jgi:chaperonin GroEL
MGDKQLTFDADARSSLMRGVDELGRVVGLTLGPGGRNVLFSRFSSFGPPVVCSDGVTIAGEVELPDIYEDMGVRLVTEAAKKTNDVVGDGTTTSVVLAQAMLHRGFMNVAAGYGGLGLKSGIDQAVAAMSEELKKMAIPVESRDQIARVAALSAHEEAIASLLADALSKVGPDGVVTVEESKVLLDELTLVEGVRLDRGYISPRFITDMERMDVVLEEPLILITDQKINSPNDIVPIMEKVISAGRNPLVIIAEDVDGEALATMLINKQRGILDCAAVKSPGFGDRRKALLEDAAILTGGQIISGDVGLSLDMVELDHLGTARRMVINKDESLIIEGRGDPQALKDRVEEIRVQITQETSEYDREKLEERRATLIGGVAVVKVGGSTEPEVNERKSRTEDALAASKAAVEEGIVPGGGVAILRAAHVLDDLVKGLEEEEALGVSLVKDALSAPLTLIARNAGYPGEAIVEGVRAAEGDWGFDAELGEYCHVIERGIVDPVKVTRSALENAGSIVGMMLTTDAIITDIPEFKPLPEDVQQFMRD